MSLSILIHVYILQYPLFYLILSFIYSGESFSIFLLIYRSMTILSNHLITISSHPSSIYLNLFLSLRQSKFTSIFFNIRFYISFYPSSINVNLFLSSCQSSRCLSLPIKNKISFYLSLSLLTTNEDQSTTKIFYILFL